MMALRLSLIISAFAAACLLPAAVSRGEACRLCESEAVSAADRASAKREIPVTIDITTRLNFSRIALTSNAKGGQVAVDPKSGGTRLDAGIVDLGGYSLAGTATIHGEPGRQIRIELPSSIRMTSANGGVIMLNSLQTDLGPAPRLDASGTLSFSFGGALQVNGNVSGNFRGRIPITAEYE
jgi:hypothetical protein